MQSLKTPCVGQIFALAKPHESGGKRTRNRIPKEERKALVESFIKKHQNLNNGSFPSLSLTHKEVGGSFYTIREIVREIIQENRVLGPGELILEGKGSDQLQDQSLSSSIPMDPVPPLSLSPDGFHSASDQSYYFSSEAEKTDSPENEENIKGHQSMCSTDISRTQLAAASCSEENDNKDKGFEEIPLMESEDTKPVNNDDERGKDAGAAMTEMVNMTKNTLGAIDLPAGTVVETFPVRSVTSTMESSVVQPSEFDKVCDDMEGTETKVDTDSSTINTVDLGEISSSTSAVLEEKGMEVIVDQMSNDSSVPMEKQVGENNVHPASVDVDCADTKETVVVNVHETKAFSNGTLTTEQKMPTSDTESGRCKNVIAKFDTMSSHARNEVASVEEKTTMEKGKLDASETSSSQTGNNATLNRIKPESWKGESNRAGHETNPFLAVLKSFLTAFVKFWSE